MKTILIILSILIAAMSSVYADTEAGLYLGSRHFDDQEYQEENPGVYVIHNNVQLGVYKNSYSDTTYILGLSSYPYQLGPAEITVGYGLVYGYGYANGYADADLYGVKLLPYIMPTISFTVQGVKINTHFIGVGLAWSISKVF